jgi:hypothetical protein
MARGGGDQIGPTRRGQGVKIMAIVDRHGVLLAVSTHAANQHKVTLVQLSFDSYMIEVKPENLIGDRAYDGDQLDEELRQGGIEMPRTAPVANGRRPRTSVGCAVTSGAGSLYASVRGCSGNAASYVVGSATPRISWASCSWHA